MKVRFGAPRESVLNLVAQLGFASFSDWLSSMPGRSYLQASGSLGGAVAPLMIALYHCEEMRIAGKEAEFEAECLVRSLVDFGNGLDTPSVVRVSGALSFWCEAVGRAYPDGMARWVFEGGYYPSDPEEEWVSWALAKYPRSESECDPTRGPRA